jgi:hypothetical protein
VETPELRVMSVPSVRPPVCDLIFQLYGRPLHPELFDIVAVRKIQREDYELVVKITRTGHVISWENEDVFLTEVTAAADQDLPLRRRLLNFKLRDEHNARLPCAHGILYEASFQVEVLAPEIFLQIHDEIVTDGGKRGLLYPFSQQDPLGMPALGFITAEARQGCLILTSFHTFPEEYTVVKTQSLIEKQPPPR